MTGKDGKTFFRECGSLFKNLDRERDRPSGGIRDRSRGKTALSMGKEIEGDNGQRGRWPGDREG